MSTLATLGFISLALLLTPAADGAQTPPAPEKRAASRRKPKILLAPSPSQESPAQRDRRLARECLGLPNAGACLGYAPPRR